jgi:hypothetical protein
MVSFKLVEKLGSKREQPRALLSLEVAEVEEHFVLRLTVAMQVVI